MPATKVPLEAARLDARLQDVQADEQTKGGRRFRGVANSGGIIEGHWFWGNFAIDMRGLRIGRQDKPILRDHRPDLVLGYTTKVTKGAEGLTVDGVLLDVLDAGKEAIALLDAGMPMQMSIYVPPRKVLKVREGESVQVNGRTLKGPGHVFEESVLREVTVTALGADENTNAALLSGGGHEGQELLVQVEVREQENETMADERKDEPKPSGAPPAAGNAAGAKPPDPAKLVDGAPQRDPAPAGQPDPVGAAVLAERQRVREIQALGAGVDETLVAKAIAEGWSREQAAVQFLQHVKERKEARLAEIRAATPKPSGTDDLESFEEKSKSTRVPPPQGEEAWKAEFTAKPELQEEFGDVEIYLAFKRHEKAAANGGRS